VTNVNATESLVSPGGRAATGFAGTRVSERVMIGFFVYTAVLSAAWGVSAMKLAIAAALPVVLLALSVLESQRGNPATAILRDWLPPAIVLGGYWQMEWFARGFDAAWQETWLAWDRRILSDWGLRQVLEAAGPAIPWLLELCYLLLYAIPPACIALLYWRRRRDRVETFVRTFALGTLTVYALLPLIAVASPRTAFAGLDAPGAFSIWRQINIAILDHLDISTSVFPSGHVAVAFSSAFGLRRALPESSGYFAAALIVALLVFTATIHGRYHYAADGVASIGICVGAALLWEVYERPA